MNRLARLTGFFREHEGADTETGAETAAADAGLQHEGDEVQVERMDPEELREPIIEALRQVHDPEIPVNIYDLGLIYRIDIAANGAVHIDMTLTAPACPVAGMMPVMVKDAVGQVEGVGTVLVDLVWDPPWTQDKMSEEAMLQLGMM